MWTRSSGYAKELPPGGKANAMKVISLFGRFVHQHFVLALLCTYVMAALLPGPALSIRSHLLGRIHLFGETTSITWPVLMLAFLLGNGGLGTDIHQLKKLWSKPQTLVSSLATNIIAPLALIYVTAALLFQWHSQQESQAIMVGLTVIASMPIAGSSTAWSQKAQGSLALSIGLVLSSTFLSPFVTPFCLRATGPLLSGDYHDDLQELSVYGTRAFLAISVILPVLLGLLLRRFAGEKRVEQIMPALKLANLLNLLLLNYCNAATALPQALHEHDLDFLLLSFFVVAIFCIALFTLGWLLATVRKVTAAERVAIVFGLGMNNNGTALVLVTSTMADHPMAILQVVLYTLVQNLVAGLVDHAISKQTSKNIPDNIGSGGAAAPNQPTEAL